MTFVIPKETVLLMREVSLNVICEKLKFCFCNNFREYECKLFKNVLDDVHVKIHFLNKFEIFWYVSTYQSFGRLPL